MAFILVAVAVFAISCSSLNRALMVPPDVPGAQFVGNKACVDCHAEIVRRFPASPHARVHFDGAGMSGQSGCESCHGAGSFHVQSAEHKSIVNPGRSPDACLRCHIETEAEFHLPQHHPVTEGRMNCVQCHDPHGSDIMKPARGLAMARSNETCADCHREQTQPVVFEHEAMREGCVTCHSPHGSVNRKMLVASDSNLCLRCHMQVQGTTPGLFYIGKIEHSAYLSVGSCWASGCHTAVHGSNVQPKMLY